MEQSSTDHRVRLPYGRWHIISEIDLAPLLADHAAFRQMCCEIEILADRTGECASAEERLAVARRIRVGIREHARVTGLLLDRFFAGERLAFGGGVLARILLGQIADGLHAEDVVQALQTDPLEHGRKDVVSYMLHCFLDGCRRALDFEELALLALAGARLSTGARLALEHVLDTSAQPAGA